MNKTTTTIRIIYTLIIVFLFNVSVSALELKKATINHPDFDITIEGEIVEKNNQ